MNKFYQIPAENQDKPRKIFSWCTQSDLRILNILYQLHNRFDRITISQYEIARRCGISREHCNRRLKLLRDYGLISFVGRYLTTSIYWIKKEYRYTEFYRALRKLLGYLPGFMLVVCFASRSCVDLLVNLGKRKPSVSQYVTLVKRNSIFKILSTITKTKNRANKPTMDYPRQQFLTPKPPQRDGPGLRSLSKVDTAQFHKPYVPSYDQDYKMRQFKDSGVPGHSESRENPYAVYVPQTVELKPDDLGELELAERVLQHALGLNIKLTKNNS